ncbi:MAG TPA: C-terminal binding protein [Gemmataceae bacterium]|nr:C-terminal binding protein [Gemmataceae bacterium]
MLNVAVTDYTFESLDLERQILEPLGCRIVDKKCATGSELLELVKEADYVITQFAPLTAAVIDTMQRCRAIVRYGIGVDNVDVEAAAGKGIPVCNVPDYCTDEVADHTLALILALNRQVLTIANQIRQGSWRIVVPVGHMRVLKEMTVGIVGYGRIGRAVVARLKPFGCKVRVFDPAVSGTEVERAGCTPVGLEELFETSDLISLHCPSNSRTRHMINRESLARMRQGVVLVNVARGSLVKTDDLVEALRRGQVVAAGLDVTDPEPINSDSPLLKMSNVIITNHIASVSVRAVAALRTGVAQTVACGIRGEPLPNVVNGVRAPA